MSEILNHIELSVAACLFTIATTLLGFIYKRVIRLVTVTAEQNKAVCEGVRAVLSSEIIDKYNRYRERECCPIYAKTNIKNLHKPYKNLGGNGVIDKLVDELLEMSTERSDK